MSRETSGVCIFRPMTGTSSLGNRAEAKGAPSRMTQKKDDRCPYCVVDSDFHPMRLLSNERLICEKCGHIVFPNDTAFWCPCPKCLEINFSPRVRGLRRPQIRPEELSEVR